MNYAEARPLIKSGHLLAWTHRSWKSWYDIKVQIVRFFTQSEYSHVALAWVVSGRVFALEAVSSGVRLYPLSRMGEFFHLPLKLLWTDETETYALAHIGDRYSQLEAIRAYFGPVDETNDVWECAEYALQVLKRAGVDLGSCATPTAVVRAAQMQGATGTLIQNPESPA